MQYVKDKRLFRRYKHTSEIFIVIETKTYKASTVDFSLKGLCIFIEGSPHLDLNSIIDLRVEDLEIDVKGKVVWLKETGPNLLVGIEKMSVSGLLKYYPLYDILLDLQRGDSTGVLEISKDLVYKRIYFDNGVMLFATSNLEEDRIEEILLKSGKITTDQYYHLVSVMTKGNRLQGKVLVDLGYLKPHEFVLAVKYQAEEIILGLFLWGDGEVTFKEMPLPANIIRLKLSASNLIFQGINRINNPEYFKHISPPLDTVLYYSNEPINLFQDILFAEKDKYVLSLLDGHLTIKEILSLSSLGRFQTLKVLCALLVTRLIDIKEKGTLEDQSLIDIIAGPQEYADEAFIKKIDNVYVKCQSMDYYSILGIDRDATQDVIRKAYFKNAKEFHPDRHMHVTSATIKDKLNLIFSYNSDAYKILSDTKEKEKYDKSLKFISPEPSKQNNLEIAKQHFMEGKKVFKKGSYTEASNLFSKAIYFDGSVADYHFYLGLTYKHQKRLRDAEKEISMAIHIKPREASYLAEAGYVYLDLGLILRAKSTFGKALKLDSSSERAAQGLRKIKDLQENQ
jgi:curved DNA-binding protein CbpA